jgi:hypothetical protein
MRLLSKFLIAAAAGASMMVPASAAPIAAPSGLQQAVAATADAQVQTVQWRGRWIGPAIIGGAIIGGAIAASRPWGYGYYGGYGPGYYGYGPGYYGDYAYDPGYAVVPAPSYGYRSYGGGGGDVAYCEQRFRSYNRATGTYTGYDGQQHPCP